MKLRARFPGNRSSPSKEELIEFVNYCLDFYGRGGIYDYGFVTLRCLKHFTFVGTMFLVCRSTVIV